MAARLPFNLLPALTGANPSGGVFFLTTYMCVVWYVSGTDTMIRKNTDAKFTVSETDSAQGGARAEVLGRIMVAKSCENTDSHENHSDYISRTEFHTRIMATGSSGEQRFTRESWRQRFVKTEIHKRIMVDRIAQKKKFT